jgi:hypothetical protein
MQCFAVASRHAQRPIGPGPLSLDGVEVDASLGGIVRTVFLEGCIGETVAAAEAVWARCSAEEQSLRSLLTGIATDESEHARLAWEFVTWALEKDSSLADELRAAAHAALESARAAASEAHDDSDAWVAAHGLVPTAVTKRMRVRVVEVVVLPCLDALIERHCVRAAA